MLYNFLRIANCNENFFAPSVTVEHSLAHNDLQSIGNQNNILTTFVSLLFMFRNVLCIVEFRCYHQRITGACRLKWFRIGIFSDR